MSKVEMPVTDEDLADALKLALDLGATLTAALEGKPRFAEAVEHANGALDALTEMHNQWRLENA